MAFNSVKPTVGGDVKDYVSDLDERVKAEFDWTNAKTRLLLPKDMQHTNANRSINIKKDSTLFFDNLQVGRGTLLSVSFYTYTDATSGTIEFKINKHTNTLTDIAENMSTQNIGFSSRNNYCYPDVFIDTGESLSMNIVTTGLNGTFCYVYPARVYFKED